MQKQTTQQPKQYVHDEWSVLADMLATLIEKYASELDIPHLPDPSLSSVERNDNC